MSTIEHYEFLNKKEREKITKYQEAKQLANNEHFKKLVIEDYCGTNANRLLGLSTDTNLSVDIRNAALIEAQAATFFKRWFDSIQREANEAEGNIKDNNANIYELKTEASGDE